MTGAQAGIRRLYEQVRVLEAEAAARPARGRRLPKALVLLAAAAIGAASAGISHPSGRRVPVRGAAAVVHLIDEPAERARALPGAEPQRAHAVRRVPTEVARVAAPVAIPVVHASASSRPVASSHTVLPTSSAQRGSVAPRVPAQRIVPAHRVLPAPPRPQPSAAPVAIGPVVVVATSEEPQPDSTP